MKALAKDNEALRKLTDKEQAKVDAVTEEITKATKALKFKNASYEDVEKAIKEAEKELYKKDIYTEESLNVLVSVIEEIDYDKDITKQAEVDKYVSDIWNAIKNLVEKPADLSTLDDIISRADKLDTKLYTKESLDTVKKSSRKS